MSKTADEALARIEHKMDVTLDLVMEIVGHAHGIRPNAIPKMGDRSHTCPICKEYVKYLVDMQERSVSAQCGCKTGKFAPLDLEQFAPPLAAGGKKDGQDDVRGSTDSHGDSGSGSGRGPKGQPR